MTPDRRPRPAREAPEVEAMIRRMLRALVRRAGAGDLFALEALAHLEHDLGGYVTEAGRAAHAEPARYSWRELGQELGISRQAAAQRFGGPGEVERGD